MECINNYINYGEKVSSFISETLGKNRNLISWNLVVEILANIEIHGSKACLVTIGQTEEEYIVEIFEDKGGFDLKDLPHGEGGYGYRLMKSNENIVSHSADGRRTFISTAKNH